MKEQFQSEKLKEIRLDKGLTIEQVAVRLKANKSSVSRWETGESAPRPRHIKQLTKMFNVPRTFFFTAEQPGA